MSDFVDRVLSTLLNPDERAAIEACRKQHEADVAQHAAMSDAELAERAAYYLTQIPEPRSPKGTPVYDTVMHHVILPEMIRRLRD